MEKLICDAPWGKAKTSRFAWVCALALAACAIIPVDAATLCVSRQTETSVTLAIETDGLDQELYLAHGATDGGDDKYAWDSFEKVADIALDQDSYEYAVPAALRDGRPMRFFLMQTQSVNMAKELVSITSTGAQWIDTGIAPVNNWSVDLRFRTGATLPNDTTFFGRQWSGSKYLFILQNDGGTKFRFYGSSNYTVSTPVANTDYRVVVDPASVLTLTGNGTEVRKSVDRGVNGSGNFAIFAVNNGNNRGSWTFYRMKIGGGSGAKIRDFVPAMNAAGDIGLYDQVNNVFYQNKTTTPFVAGADRPAARFGRVLSFSPTFRFRRTVAVASATASDVTLSFGNPDGNAYKLYVAYGAEDCETRKNAWTSWEEVATIAADATEYTYTLPAALKADGVYFRFFLVKTDNLPYVSELASITSTGAQVVRLDYVPGLNTEVDLCFGGVTYENQKTFFGQGWAGSCFLFNMQSDTFRFHGGGATFPNIVPTANTDYRCVIEKSGKCLLRDGMNSSAMTESLVCYPYSDLCVFASYGGGYAAKYRFDSMIVKDGGMVVRDLVPVQTAAGKGALFDRVSGVVFENPTATDFTKGAATARPGWAFATTEPSLAGSASGAPGAIGGLGSYRLDGDTEWSAIESRLDEGASINLNGHELHIADYPAFAMKQAVFTSNAGSIRVTVPANETLTFNSGNKPQFTGTLVKDGAGTLVIANSMSYLSGVTVAAGIMKYGAQSVFGNNGMTVEVKNGAAFDVAGNGNGNAVRYKIAGTGPDGNGALRNTGGDVTNGSAQMYGLELTADAKVTGNSQGFIGPSYAANTLVLNGHTLTLALNSGKSFWFCNASSSTSGTVLVTGGNAYFHRNAVNFSTVDFVIDGATAKFQIPTGTVANPTTVKSVTVKNGGTLEEGYQASKMQDLIILDGGYVGQQNHVKWIYVANTVTVSNETTDVTIHPPIESNSTYSKLLKYGAGTLNIKNNHTQQRMNSGVEIFGGTVVMDSTASTLMPEIAISDNAAVPVTIHAGGTLDMRLCTNATPFKVTKVTIEEGGTLLHAANNNLSIAGAATYEKPIPFGVFAGSLEIAATVTFDLTDFYSGASAPAGTAAEPGPRRFTGR